MFDTERLIYEVEKRPGIYNIKSKEYSNRDLKAKMWEEVAKTMYENWAEIPIEERNKLGRELQTRWKSLRDQFRKEVRATRITHSGASGSKKKKKYVYFDQLLFLLPSINPRVTASNLVECPNGNEMTIPEETTPLHEPSSQQTPAAETSHTRKRPRNARNMYSDSNEIREMTKVLFDTLALQNENKLRDTFGNKAFVRL